MPQNQYDMAERVSKSVYAAPIRTGSPIFTEHLGRRRKLCAGPHPRSPQLACNRALVSARPHNVAPGESAIWPSLNAPSSVLTTSNGVARAVGMSRIREEWVFDTEVAAIANHVCSAPNNRHFQHERTRPFRADFGCKSQLRAAANRDSVVLTRISVRWIHDGPSEERGRSTFLPVQP
jgi:hypothetical protein